MGFFLSISISVIMIIASLVYIIFYIYKSIISTPTNIETVFFAIGTNLFTASASMLITYVLAKKKFDKDIRALGQSAIRHIKQIIISTNILKGTIIEKISVLKNVKNSKKSLNRNLVLEYFDNILNQLNSLSGGINTAKMDWANVLSEEMKESIKSDEGIIRYINEIRTLKQEINEKEKIILSKEKEKKEYKELADEQKEKVKLLKEKQDALEIKLTQIESEPFRWPTPMDINTSSLTGLNAGTIGSSKFGLNSGTAYDLLKTSLEMCEICNKQYSIYTCKKCNKKICMSCSSDPLSFMNSAICKNCSTK